MSSGHYFTTPVEAVMGCLTKRGEEPDRCSPVRIADEAGMPIAMVHEVVRGCWGACRNAAFDVTTCAGVAIIGLLAAYLRRIRI